MRIGMKIWGGRVGAVGFVAKSWCCWPVLVFFPGTAKYPVRILYVHFLKWGAGKPPSPHEYVRYRHVSLFE